VLPKPLDEHGDRFAIEELQMEPEPMAVNAILVKQPNTARGDVPDICGNRVGREVALSDSIAPHR
jgi:hypothetical protein